MTRDEAIEIMSKLSFVWEIGRQTVTQKQIDEALEMAFKALEQEPKENDRVKTELNRVKTELEPCGDCIGRAELLKAIDTWDKFGCDANTKLVPYKDHYVPYIHYDDVIKCIKGMPSVKQEPKTDGDCISRKELLKKCVHVPIAPIVKGDNVHYEEIVFATDIINAETKTGWIPVSERLPEKNMPCLVSPCKLCSTQIVMYSDLMGTIDHKIFWIGDYGKYNFEDITKYVKAWMPLPEPYEESEGK